MKAKEEIQKQKEVTQINIEESQKQSEITQISMTEQSNLQEQYIHYNYFLLSLQVQLLLRIWTKHLKPYFLTTQKHALGMLVKN